ncbi:hypothetical protein B0T18DRAFT_251650 [Schizothecium vesticola]|uniref:Uncharacterized protein n=1 Tax=Schizothecium vesticola TaxID=314040 RepID=A0AA40BQU0_9PEZI|nr:hypothetical protein B0T18DRAFT_251650 [Schizothecium vesticola]
MLSQQLSSPERGREHRPDSGQCLHSSTSWSSAICAPCDRLPDGRRSLPTHQTPYGSPSIQVCLLPSSTRFVCVLSASINSWSGRACLRLMRSQSRDSMSSASGMFEGASASEQGISMGCPKMG